MDILNEIQLQITSIKKIDGSSYLDSILTHIDRAEIYYNKGKKDSNFFNDVIYRSNQAYEGALKESYKVLADKTQEEVLRKSPNEIEKFFETNSIFRERVLQLFKNYRQEWRNKSTHDYKLFFDENEAFIALTSVTSFVHLLLKQIQEKVAYSDSQRKLEEEKAKFKKLEILLLDAKNPKDKLLLIITEFSKLYGKQILNNNQNTEFEIIGLFHAFIESLKSFKVEREPKLKSGLRPDFLITIDDTLIVLEFKRFQNNNSGLQNAENQVVSYMQEVNTEYGVIYFPKFTEEEPEAKITDRFVFVSNEVYFVSNIIT